MTRTLAELIAIAEHLSPERHPDQAVTLNQQILSLDPQNAAASVRLARAYQAQRKFAEAKAACQEALRLNPGSVVAKQRLQRIAEEGALAALAQAITSFEEALLRGVEQKDQEYAGGNCLPVAGCRTRAPTERSPFTVARRWEPPFGPEKTHSRWSERRLNTNSLVISLEG